MRRVVSAPALRRGASLACLPLAAVGLLASPAVGAPSQQVPIGPRAIGMGGAFSAIADDATALFWNPAGLARLGHQELAGAHADLFGAGIKDDHAAFVLPLSPRDAAGIDWYHSGFDDGELGFGENRADVGYALELRRWLYAGAGAKLLTRSISLDGTEIRGGRGYGMDLGLLASPREHVWLGLVAQDALGTRLHYADGAPEEVYPRNLRIGGAYTAPRWGTAALDIDDRWHAGLELTPLQQLALRVGTQKDRNTGEPATWTYGFGLKAGALRFDYARVEAPALPATDHFGVAMEFNFNPALIRIERVETRDLYTSLYQTYAREPFGSVRVRSLQDRPLAARLSVFVPGLMDAPSDGEIILRPKATLDVPLTAVLSPAVLTQRGDRAVQVQVSASYQSRRVMRREKGSARCVAYAPGAIRWGLGVAQAAAWVTPQDPAVTALAREAARVVALQGLDPLGNRNLGFAAAITDALAQLELAYVPDPTNPYSRIGESEEAVDTIFYPYETLARHTGDCDDTTVLMASLLASVGVSTRFADAPGHIFLLIDTGLHERNRPALAVDDGMTVIADEEVWIPFETTAISRGFTEAWRIGSETYRSWSARGEIGQVDVTQAQARYAPALPPGERPPVHVDPERLARRLLHVALRRRPPRSHRLGRRADRGGGRAVQGRRVGRGSHPPRAGAPAGPALGRRAQRPGGGPGRAGQPRSRRGAPAHPAGDGGDPRRRAAQPRGRVVRGRRLAGRGRRTGRGHRRRRRRGSGEPVARARRRRRVRGGGSPGGRRAADARPPAGRTACGGIAARAWEPHAALARAPGRWPGARRGEPRQESPTRGAATLHVLEGVIPWNRKADR